MFGYKPTRRERMAAADAYEKSRQIGEALRREGDAWMIKNIQTVVDAEISQFQVHIERINETSRLSPITRVRTELVLFLSTIEPLRKSFEEKAELGLAHLKRRLTEMGHAQAFEDFVTTRLDAIALPTYAVATDLANERIAELKAQGFADEYVPS